MLIFVRNKANSAGGEREGKCRLERELRRIVPERDPGKTKPILARPGRTRPGGRGPWELYKQSQFAPKRQTGQVLLAKGFMVSYTYTGPQQNKANFRHGRVERGQGDSSRAVLYKQSQSAQESQVGGWTTRSVRAKQSQFPPTPGETRLQEHRSPANCAKRTEFAQQGRVGRSQEAWDERNSAKQSQLGPVVRGGGPGYNGTGQDIVKLRI
jgi:hypothetical protein